MFLDRSFALRAYEGGQRHFAGGAALPVFFHQLSAMRTDNIFIGLGHDDGFHITKFLDLLNSKWIAEKLKIFRVENLPVAAPQLSYEIPRDAR